MVVNNLKVQNTDSFKTRFFFFFKEVVKMALMLGSLFR